MVEDSSGQTMVVQPIYSMMVVVDLETKPCPFCAETIQAVAVKCRFCGEFLNTVKSQGFAEGC
jgi:hypothetical protein